MTSTRADATRLAAVALALALVVGAFAPATAIPQPADTVGVQQTADAGTVAPGGSVTLEATINATGYNAPAIALDLPMGWNVTGQAADGPATYKPSTNEWVWLSGGEYAVEYTLAVPAGAATGDYDVTAEGSAIDPADDSFVTNEATTTITVDTDATNQAPTADAGGDQTVDEGASVTLDATGSSDPDGDALAYAWTQTGGPSVSLTDATTATPTFTAPEVEGDQTLTFEVTVDDGQATDADAVAVNVVDTDDATSPISVTQTAASSSVTPGGTLELTATVDATDLNAPALDVDLPAGWSITNQTAEGPATYKPSTNEWVWLSGGEYAVTYEVTVPTDAAPGDYAVDAGASAIVPADDSVANDSASTPISVVADDGDGGDGPATQVSLQPATALVGVDDAVALDVVVESATGGVGAYDLNVSVDDPSVAAIVDVTFGPGTGPLAEFQISGDGSTASLEAATVDTADEGSVTIATITLEGETEGLTTASLSVDALGNETAATYDVTGTVGSTVTVSNLVVGDAGAPAQDPDGDGAYEDVDGDGDVDGDDVSLLFEERHSGVVTGNPAAFDFDGSGDFDVIDVQALHYQEVA